MLKVHRVVHVGFAVPYVSIIVNV